MLYYKSDSPGILPLSRLLSVLLSTASEGFWHRRGLYIL